MPMHGTYSDSDYRLQMKTCKILSALGNHVNIKSFLSREEDPSLVFFGIRTRARLQLQRGAGKCNVPTVREEKGDSQIVS